MHEVNTGSGETLIRQGIYRRCQRTKDGAFPDYRNEFSVGLCFGDIFRGYFSFKLVTVLIGSNKASLNCSSLCDDQFIAGLCMSQRDGAALLNNAESSGDYDKSVDAV